MTTNYKITPYYNDIDYNTANKVLEHNKQKLDNIKQKLNSLIQKNLENDTELQNKNETLRLNMIDTIKNKLINIKRNITYNTHYN